MIFDNTGVPITTSISPFEAAKTMASSVCPNNAMSEPSPARRNYPATGKTALEKDWEFTALLQSIPQAVIYLNADGTICMMNAAAERIVGVSKDQLMQATVFDIHMNALNEDGSVLHPDKNPILRAIKEGVAVRDAVIGIMSRKNGQCRWMKITALPHRLPDGNMPAEVFVTFEEITERRIAQQNLQKAEERYRHLFNSIGDGISLVSINDDGTPGKIIDVNDELCRILGYTRNEMLSFKPPDICEMSFDLWQESITQLRKSKHAIFELVGIAADGHRIPVEMNNHIIDFEGKPHYLSIARDLTERKKTERKLLESEKRFREMFETSADGIATTDFEGNITDCNRAFISMLGYSTLEELLSKSFRDFSPAEYHDLDRKMIRGTIEKGYCDVYEKEYLRKDGGRFPVNIRRWLQRDSTDRPIGQWAIIRNISEKKRMDAEIMKARHIESLSKLAGGIAHDFNNLLGGIFGYIDIARELADSPVKTGEYLTKAVKMIGRAKNLTQRFLTFSKGGAPVKSLCSIADIIRDTVTLTLAGKNVVAQLKIAENLSFCDIDAAQIAQVINNILTNAQHAMPDGGTVMISVKNLRVSRKTNVPCANGAYVKITIKDHGCGIPKSILDHVFDPFAAPSPKGVGLGLSICHSVIKQHNGHIAIKSEVGKGTEVVIYLPASQEIAYKAENTTEKPIHGHGKILVMDDEDFVLEIAAKMLSSIGYTVKTVQHGEEAINVFKKSKEQGSPFDAIILDLTVTGGMGGAKTCENLLHIDPGANVIASSGFSNDPVMANPAKFGFKAILKKPYLSGELSAILHKLVPEG